MKGQCYRVKTLTEIALENGVKPEDVLEKSLIPGMRIIGDKFRDNILFISDVLIASRAMHAGLNVLKPHLSACRQVKRGKVVIGTVAGDLHDIGKNLVAMMLRGNGLEVVDLGVDVEPEDFVKAVIEYRPDILGISAMLTTTLYLIPETINMLKQRNLRSRVKVIVGGGPVTKEFSQKVKADGFATDAQSAVELVNNLLESE